MNVYPIMCRIRAAGGVTRVDIYDDIGEGSWFDEGLTSKAFAAQLAGVHGPLDVHINSYGGDVGQGIAINNAIRGHKGRKTTVVDGFAASIASVIAQAGDERVMEPGLMMMLHDASTLCAGNAAAMRAAAETLDKHSDNLAEIYAARAGGTPQHWRGVMQGDDTWYTADEAVAAGLADRVGDGYAQLPAGLDLAAYAIPGRVAAALRQLPRAAAASTAEQHGHPGQPCWDPDGDGDCDVTPEGDTDHDYWAPDGTQKKPVPGKPMDDALAAQIRAVMREELIAAGLWNVKKPHGDVEYADPGYLDADGEQVSKSGKEGVARYPIDAEHVAAAWSYINQEKNASQYTAEQLASIKSKIKSAMKQHGHEVSEDGPGNLSEQAILAMFAGAIQLGAGKE